MKTENFQSGFPERLESVKITMGHRNVDCNQFSSTETGCCATEARTAHRPVYRVPLGTYKGPSTGARPPYTTPPQHRLRSAIIVLTAAPL